MNDPVLLGDFGGTNARFAVLPAPGAAPILLPRTLVADHPSPVPALAAALAHWTGAPPRQAVIAVACKVEGPVAHLTNAAWTIDAGEIGRAFGFSSVRLVNDYAPVAAALAAADLATDGSHPIGPLEPVPDRAARLVLGPGTGLGAAALLPAGECLLIQTTEAGHVCLGAAHPDEEEVWPHLERVHGRLTAEAVLSGPGLYRLYGALCAVRGHERACLLPNDVIEAALGERDALARETLLMFTRLLGRFAGDLALIFGASGGVYLGSGIAPRIIPVLEAGPFREAFEDKAPFAAFAKGIPTAVLTFPEPALTGLSLLAAHPQRFLVASGDWAA